jgi:glycosyltransferase involved in cell wall biosynthesis
MRILVCSIPFAPSIGGLETISELLVSRFHSAGHEVRLVTQTPSSVADTQGYPIIRRPSARALLQQMRWAEVVLHNNISLRFAWPLLITRRPWVIAHHMWSPHSGVGRIKHFATRFATNIAVSNAMARTLTVPSTIVPNAYADDVFICQPNARRSRDLVFLGRLVPSKGVPVIIDALAALRAQGETRKLTIIGGGPEEAALRAQVQRLGLAEQVSFAGFKQGRALVDLLNEHRIMIAPSVDDEPFGIVALEAIACGLIPIVADSGGLPDAIGPCGLVVPKADSAALGAAIVRLNDEVMAARLRAQAKAHLEQHSRDKIAQAYLRVLNSAAAGK